MSRRALQGTNGIRARLVRASELVLLPLAIGAIAFFTLSPIDGGQQREMERCLICGSRGLADAVLNLLLFVPLGAGVALRGGSTRRALLFGGIASLVIETAQLGIPGRDPSAGDLLFNTLGAGIGAAALLWFRRPDPGSVVASRFSLGAGVAAAAVLALTGILLQPALPPRPYYGQWTANLGHLEWYRGRVLSAHLGPVEIPPYLLPDGERLKSLFAGTPLRVRAVAGPPPPALAPLLSVYNGAQQEVVLLGVDRDDLVLRYRTRAAALRLDQPDLRAAGAMRSVAAGAGLAVDIARDGRAGWIVRGPEDAARLGWTLGRGWAMLMYPESLSDGVKRLLDAIWIALLLFPLGFWTAWRPETGIGVGVVVVAFFAIPPATGLLATPATELLGALFGFTVGAGVRSFLLRPRITARTVHAGDAPPKPLHRGHGDCTSPVAIHPPRSK